MANNNNANIVGSSSESLVEKFSLPGTLEEVATILKDNSTSDEIKLAIQKYSGAALSTGRPLDSLQIILAGYSGKYNEAMQCKDTTF